MDINIPQEPLVRFTRELIQIQSWNPPGDEAVAAERVAAEMRTLGLETEVIPLTSTRANVVGRLRGNGSSRGLMLVGHLDTVPPGSGAWSYAPLSADLSNGRIYGRGTADMKGGLAAAIYAAGSLKQSGMALSGDLLIAGTAGEEVDCLGAQALLRSGHLDGMTALGIPEPTGLELFTAHKGALWVKITTRGRTAHGSRPDLGINAILHMQKLISRIISISWETTAHPLLGTPTINVATIQGGTKTNMIPDHCELTIDFRSLPSQDHAWIVQKIQTILAGLSELEPGFSAELEVTNDKAAMETPSEHPFVRLAQDVGQSLWGKELEPKGVTYYTDASVLAAKSGLPTIILGPGEAALAHQTDEWVSIDNIVETARFYARLAARYLGDPN